MNFLGTHFRPLLVFLSLATFMGFILPENVTLRVDSAYAQPEKRSPKPVRKTQKKVQKKSPAPAKKATAATSSTSVSASASSAAPAANATGAANNMGFGQLLGPATESGSPITVTSDTLSLDANSRVFTYRGNVKAVRDDMTIVADRMVGNYDENNKLQTLRAEDHVVITRGEILRATSQRAFFRIAANTLELTENPELINKGNALTADKITLYLNEDRSNAEGDVRVRILKAEDLSTALKGQAASAGAQASSAPATTLTRMSSAAASSSSTAGFVQSDDFFDSRAAGGFE